MLRNIALTAPYGHNGAYPTLDGIVRHHLDPLAALDAYRRDLARLPKVEWLQQVDFIVDLDVRETQRHRSRVDIAPIQLSEGEIGQLIVFLENLTGETAQDLPLGRPEAVPSGLPVD